MPVAADFVRSGPVGIVPNEVACYLEPIVSVFDLDRVAMVCDSWFSDRRVDNDFLLPGSSCHLSHISPLFKYLTCRVLHLILKFKFIFYVFY